MRHRCRVVRRVAVLGRRHRHSLRLAPGRGGEGQRGGPDRDVRVAGRRRGHRHRPRRLREERNRVAPAAPFRHRQHRLRYRDAGFGPVQDPHGSLAGISAGRGDAVDMVVSFVVTADVAGLRLLGSGKDLERHLAVVARHTVVYRRDFDDDLGLGGAECLLPVLRRRNVSADRRYREVDVRRSSEQAVRVQQVRCPDAGQLKAGGLAFVHFFVDGFDGDGRVPVEDLDVDRRHRTEGKFGTEPDVGGRSVTCSI